MSLINLTPAQLRHAADLKEKIESLQAELGRLHGAPAIVAVAAKRGGRKISAAGLARIRAGQKARWARVNGANGATLGRPPGKRGPRKMSAAARAAIGAAARARWARFHAAKAAAAK
jgi:hypothetical protein